MDYSINVVQFCECDSVFNDGLQDHLTKNDKFNSKYHISSIYINRLLDEYYNNKQNGIFTKLLAYRHVLCRLNRDYIFDKQRDILNIQFVSRNLYMFVGWIRSNFKKVIVSYWGSDLLNPPFGSDYINKRILNVADYITLETPMMRKIFHKKYNGIYDDKVKEVRFGFSTLETIDDVSAEDVRLFAENQGFPSNKTIIAIGYNRAKTQNHIAIIKSIIQAGIDRNKYFIVIPWTYAYCSMGYYRKLNELLSCSGYDFKFLTTYMNENEVAAFRKLTSIMIQAQKTDSMSASMMETLYAGNIVITGGWLPYDDFIKSGMTIVTIESVREVGNVIKTIHSRMDYNKVEKNREIIHKMCSWEKNTSKWIDMYDA